MNPEQCIPQKHNQRHFCQLYYFITVWLAELDINPSKKVLHIQLGGQYLPQYIIFCYMSYLIMESWLSSFPMIPISLVYSFSGMNDSFMNGVGVPSVKCQISISTGIGGQYLPQYNIFCYISGLITEAWSSSFPMISISSVYPFSGMNDSFMNGGIGGQYPNTISVQTMLLGVLLNLLCPVHTYRITILKGFFALTLITMLIITMIHTVTCHVCHLWIKPVALGKYRQVIRKSEWQSSCLE